MPISRQINASDINSLLSTGRKLAALGDSITARAYSVSSPFFSKNSLGYLDWVNILTRQQFICPPEYNFGINGNTTTQMFARISDVLAVRPDICIVHAGTNDIGNNFLPSTSINNLGKIYDTLNGAGILVVAMLITGSSSGARAALTSTQIANGQYINEWIRRQAYSRKNFVVVDPGLLFDDPTSSTWAPRSGYTVDGLHSSQLGAYFTGKAIADKLNVIYSDWRVSTASPSDAYDVSNNPYGNLLSNGLFTGTGGTLGGVTGSIATGWASSNGTLGGATAALSKVTLADGRPAQQIDLSGTFTGSNMSIPIYATPTAGNIQAGDTVEAEVEFFLANNSQNIQSIVLDVWTNEGGTVYHSQDGVGTAGYVWPSVAINGILKTPPRKLTVNPTAVNVFITTNFASPGSATPIAATVQFTSATLRKV